MAIALIITGGFATLIQVWLVWIDLTDDTHPFNAVSLYLIAVAFLLAAIVVVSPFLLQLRNSVVRTSAFSILAITVSGVLVFGESTFGVIILGPLIAALIGAALGRGDPGSGSEPR